MKLRDYLQIIGVRKWVVVQAILIVTLTATGVSFLQTPTYEGEAKVLITDRDAGTALRGFTVSEFTGPVERNLQTQIQLMQVRAIAEETVRELGLRVTPDELLHRVNISAVGQTNIISVVATDPDPEMAALIANHMAGGFVNWSQQVRRESIAASAAEVELRLEDAQGQILEVSRRISDEGKTDELEAELGISAGLYTTLAEKLELLRIQQQLETGAGRVVGPAVVSETPVSPKPLHNGIIGLAVGLVFGLGMAFLYEHLDSTIKSVSYTHLTLPTNREV